MRFPFQRPWVGVALKEGKLDWLGDAAEKASVPIMMLLTQEMPSIPVAELEWIMGRGLSEWIGWP